MIIGLYDDDKIVQEEEMSPDNLGTEQQTPVEPPVDTTDSEPTEEEEPIDDDDNDIEIIDDEEVESPEDNSGETPIPPAETSDEAEAMENIDSESKEIDHFADDMEKPAEPVPNNDVYFNGENPYQTPNASPIPVTPTTPTPAAVGIDVTMTNFGNDNSPQQNQYNPKEVERLNDLIASENSAIGEYFQASKETNVDVLRRLFSDIGEEERFHVEQLLFAKSQVTGERYVPRDPDIKKEYEELLSMGMDEESAMATAVDKVGLISRNFTISPEETVHEMAMLSDNVCMLSEYVYGEIIDEDSTLFVEADGGSANNGILHTIANAIRRLIGFITSFVKKSGKFVAAKARFIKNHGFGNLFKDGFELYFYNIEKGGKEGFAYDEAANYLVRMAYCANWIARDAGLRLEFSPQSDMEFQGYNHENYQPKNLDDSVNGIRNVSMMKTKVMITEQNQNYLKEQLFGVNGTDANNVSSDSAMTNLGLLLKDFSKLITALEKLNNSLVQLQNPQQKATFEKYLSVVTAQAQKFSGYITHDIGVIQKMNQTIIEAAQKDHQATDQITPDQEPTTSDEGGVVQVDDQGVATVVGEVIDFAKNEVQQDPSIVDSINENPEEFNNGIEGLLAELKAQYGDQSAYAPGNGGATNPAAQTSFVGDLDKGQNESSYIEIVDDDEFITEAANPNSQINNFLNKIKANIERILNVEGRTQEQRADIISKIDPELRRLGPNLTSMVKLQEGGNVTYSDEDKGNVINQIKKCSATIKTITDTIKAEVDKTTPNQAVVSACDEIVKKLTDIFNNASTFATPENNPDIGRINNVITILNEGLQDIPEQLNAALNQTTTPNTPANVTEIKTNLDAIVQKSKAVFNWLANGINNVETSKVNNIKGLGILFACIGDRVKGSLGRVGNAITNAFEMHRRNVTNKQQLKNDAQTQQQQIELTSQANAAERERLDQNDKSTKDAKITNATERIKPIFDKAMQFIVTPVTGPSGRPEMPSATIVKQVIDNAIRELDSPAVHEYYTSIEIVDDIFQEGLFDGLRTRFENWQDARRDAKMNAQGTKQAAAKLNEVKAAYAPAIENVWKSIVDPLKAEVDRGQIQINDIFNTLKTRVKEKLNYYATDGSGGAGDTAQDHINTFINSIQNVPDAVTLSQTSYTPQNTAQNARQHQRIVASLMPILDGSINGLTSKLTIDVAPGQQINGGIKTAINDKLKAVNDYIAELDANADEYKAITTLTDFANIQPPSNGKLDQFPNNQKYGTNSIKDIIDQTLKPQLGGIDLNAVASTPKPKVELCNKVRAVLSEIKQALVDMSTYCQSRFTRT